MSWPRRTATPATLALALVFQLIAPTPAADAQAGFSVQQTGASSMLLTFRAPSTEGDDCCSSFSYLMVVRAPADCLRRSFADLYWRGGAEGQLHQFGEVRANNRSVGYGIEQGDIVTVSMTGLAPCAAAYRGRVIFEEAYDNPDPPTRTRIGQFEVHVGPDGALALTGIDVRLLLATAAGLCGLGLVARRPKRPSGPGRR
jgi:hypothetical protein